MSAPSLRANFTPKPGADPSARLSPYHDTIGIPIIGLAGKHELYESDLTLHYDDPGESIRYLRQLAAVATDLADEIERAATTEVLLKS